VSIDKATRELVKAALAEDLGKEGDLSTERFLPGGRRYKARLVAKADGVLFGTKVVDEVFKRAAYRAGVRWLVKDGGAVRKGTVLARIEGPRAILTAERTALNFLQYLSGIATLSRAYARAVKGGRTRVFDTRKTHPGYRTLAKAAVRAGGCKNHRMGLYDMVMLKDNHLAAAPETLRARVRAFRKKHPRVKIEIEASDATEVGLALDLGADIILLDNMTPARLRTQISKIRRTSTRTQVEISGGVALKDIPKLARLGADRISVGRLTHSVSALDISMKVDPA